VGRRQAVDRDAARDLRPRAYDSTPAFQKIFLLVGPKRGGKGIISRILTALVGADNITAPTLSSLSQNFGCEGLIGKTLAIISDARLGRSREPGGDLGAASRDQW
jgi:phage/plasmid-associated DNA primase